MSLEADSFVEQAGDNKSCSTLKEDLKKLSPKLAKVTRGVRQLCINTNKEAVQSELAKLFEDFNKVTTSYAEMREWALRLGLRPVAGAKRARKGP